MRISDWSSDVCSSDLARPCARRALYRHRGRALAGLLSRRNGRGRPAHQLCPARYGAPGEGAQSRRHDRRVLLRRQSRHGVVVREGGADRKSVEEGQSVAVRVALGGRRIIKKKKRVEESSKEKKKQKK